MSTYTSNDHSKPNTTRCAVYARFSSDNQSPTSIRDQVRNCEKAAQEKGWIVLPDYIRSDEGVSGESLAGRPGLLWLLEQAKQKSRPYDCLLIDSTSRFARDNGDGLTVTKRLHFHGAFIYFVAERLDTRDPFSKKMQMLHGMKDEDFLKSLRHNVRRGMAGKALEGRHLGGTHYGYDRDLVNDPTRKDEHGREAVAYVDLKRNAAQAAIIIQIFNLRAAGKSLIDITKGLNKQSVPGPRGKGWSYTGVRTILNDELYIGIKTWNTTMNVKDPESGKIIAKPRPQTEWITKEMPHLRIVPQDLWEKVREVNDNAKTFGRQKLGGMNRTEKSRTYIFSGHLKCGLCGGSMTIVGGGNRMSRYGCRAHRQEAKCSNKATIRVDRLEEQLLRPIVEKLQPEVINKSLEVFQQQIEAYLADQSSTCGLDEASLKTQVQQLKKEQSNIIRAIASLGGSDCLFEELTRIATELKQLNKELEILSEPAPNEITFEEFKAFTRTKANDLNSVLRGDPALAKQTISRIINRLVLTPIETPEGPVFDVTGDIDLFAGENCALLNLAVDRTNKHYTQLLTLNGLRLDPRKPLQNQDLCAGGSEFNPAMINMQPLPTHNQQL